MSKSKDSSQKRKLSEGVFNISPDPIFWVSIDGNIMEMNDVFINLLHLDNDSSGKISWFDIDENLSRREWKDIWLRLGEYEEQVVETTITNKSGEQLPVELNFSFAKDGDSSVCCVFVIDISEKIS